jgi:hypothetical protein
VRAFFSIPLFSVVAFAQQPFYTDDADVAGYGKFHMEFSNQHSWLQRSVFPSLRQNTAVFQLNYGVLPNLEVGIDSPLLAVFNAPGSVPLTPVGIGDTNLTIKWNFHHEKGESRWPALTVSFAIETPTGDVARQLGSGLADYGFNSVMQKHLSAKTVVRFNNGVLLSGNTLTGVVGLKAQGIVYSTGVSITREISETLRLGGEVNGAVAQNALLGKAALQTQFGGKYVLWKATTIDFGLLAGRFAGSPRFGIQLGFSKDF